MNSEELDFSDLKQQAEDLLNIYKEQTIELQKQAQVVHSAISGSSVPVDTAGIKAQTQAKKEALVIDGQLTQKKKDQIAAQTLLNQLSSVERQNLKDSEALKNAAADSYTAMSIEMKKLTQEWKNGSAEVREKLSPQIDTLNNKLKAADETIGVHNRNVGNYANSIRGLATQLSGATGLLDIFGKIVGIDTEKLEVLKEIHTTLREASRDLSHVTHEHTEAMQEEAVASTELAEAQEASLGPLGWALIAITALGVGILAYIEISKEAKKAEEDYSKAMDGTVIIDKKLRDSYNESLIKLGSLNDEYQILLGNMDKYQAKANEINRKSKKDLTDLADEHKKKVYEIQNSWSSLLLNGLLPMSGLAELSNKKALAEEELNYLVQYNDAVAIADDDLRNNQKEKDKEEEKRHRKALEEEAELRNQLTEDFKKKGIEALRDQERIELKSLEIKRDAERVEILDRKHTDQELIDFDTITYLTKDKIIKDFNHKVDEYRREQLEKDIEYFKRVTEVFKKQLEERKKAFDTLTQQMESDSDRHINSIDAVLLGNAKMKTKLDEEFANKSGLTIKQKSKELDQVDVDRKIEVELETNSTLDKAAEDHQKRLEEINKRNYAKTLEGAKLKAKALETEELDYNDKIAQINQEAGQKLHEIDEETTRRHKEELKKRLEDEIKLQEETLKALEQALDADNQLREDSLKTQTQMIQNEAQVQATLAAAGRKNTLDQAMAAENRAAEEAKKIQRQQQREKEAIALAELFIQAESAYVKGGAPPTQAAAQALGAVLLAKGIASGIAGTFFEGTEDTGGPGQLDNKGGMLAVIHPHERIIPASQNALLGGISNEDLINNYLKLSDIRVNQPVYNDSLINEVRELKDEMIGVKEAIEKMPSRVSFQQNGDTIIDEVSSNGHRRIIVEQPETFTFFLK